MTAVRAQGPVDPLEDVKQLYGSASYQAALTALDQISDHVDANEIDEYRALCFLGLNRTRDAERTLERIVMRRPSTAYDPAIHPPKLVAVYRAVKSRTLPLAAAALYVSAKASFERDQLVAASALFRELLALPSDPEEAAALRDLTLLADGFLRLSEQRLADAALRALSPPPVETPATPLPPTASRSLFGPDDVDVIPPVAVDQKMPAWIPPTTFLATRTFHGTLEIIIGEDGAVVSESMSAPVFPRYDWELLTAARRWKYTPATRHGRPVKYRKVIAVTLGGAVKSE